MAIDLCPTFPKLQLEYFSVVPSPSIYFGNPSNEAPIDEVIFTLIKATRQLNDPPMEFEMIYKHLSGRQMLGTPSLVESSGCWNYQGDEEHDD